MARKKSSLDSLPVSAKQFPFRLSNPDVYPETAKFFGEGWDFDVFVSDVKRFREQYDSSADCQDHAKVMQFSEQFAILHSAIESLLSCWMTGDYGQRARPHDRKKNYIDVAAEVTFEAREEGEVYEGSRSKDLTPEQLAEVERRWKLGINFHIQGLVAATTGVVRRDSLRACFPNGHIVDPRKYKYAVMADEYVQKVPSCIEGVSGFEEPYVDANGVTHKLSHVMHIADGTMPDYIRNPKADKKPSYYTAIRMMEDDHLSWEEVQAQNFGEFSTPMTKKTVENYIENKKYLARVGTYDPDHDRVERCATWHYGAPRSGKSHGAYDELVEKYGLDNVYKAHEFDDRKAWADKYAYEAHISYDEIAIGDTCAGALMQEFKNLITTPGTLGSPMRFSARYQPRKCAVRGKDAIHISCVHSPVEWAARLPRNHYARDCVRLSDGELPVLDGSVYPEFEKCADEKIDQLVLRLSAICFHWVSDWDRWAENRDDPSIYRVEAVYGPAGMMAFLRDPLILEKRAREHGMRETFEEYQARIKADSGEPDESIFLPPVSEGDAAAPAPDAPDPDSDPDPDPDPAPDASGPVPAPETPVSEPPALPTLPDEPTADDYARCADALLGLLSADYLVSGTPEFDAVRAVAAKYARLMGGINVNVHVQAACYRLLHPDESVMVDGQPRAAVSQGHVSALESELMRRAELMRLVDSKEE